MMVLVRECHHVMWIVVVGSERSVLENEEVAVEEKVCRTG